MPARWAGPPLHHHDFDEAFYVLDGALTFQVGDARQLAGPGRLAFAPRGSHHTLANSGDAPARYLLVCTPGGFELRFDAANALPYPETTVVGPQIDAADGDGVPLPDPPPGPIRVLVRGEETGGVVSLVDNDLGAGSPGPYVHTHDFDEALPASRSSRSATSWCPRDPVTWRSHRAACRTRSRTATADRGGS